jgi:hypothetical protein
MVVGIVYRAGDDADSLSVIISGSIAIFEYDLKPLKLMPLSSVLATIDLITVFLVL